MTGQQVIDFIKAYKPVQNPYNNMTDEVYNARRCAGMAKKEYNLNEADKAAIMMAYLLYGVGGQL